MKLRPIFKIHGGKYYLKEFVISNFPKNYEDLTYVETCAGGCSILLNKLRSKREILNDIDKNIYNLLYCLKTSPNEISKIVKDIEYNLETFSHFKVIGATNDLANAIRELALRRMSRGGMKEDFSWSERKRGGKPGDANAWDTFKLMLPDICKRLKDVEITNKDIFELLTEMGTMEDVLWYIDPPYLPSTRTASKVYNAEMTEEDHVKLGEMLKSVKGKVLLSGYYSNLYAKMFKGWELSTREIANHASQAKEKQRRIECLWKNY